MSVKKTKFGIKEAFSFTPVKIQKICLALKLSCTSAMGYTVFSGNKWVMGGAIIVYLLCDIALIMSGEEDV